MKIGILGIGGVGGFIGAKLAQSYKEDASTDVIFICRGETKKQMKETGLTLISEGHSIHASPDLTSDDPDDIGKLDLLIITTKAYSLPAVINQFRSCIHKDTLLIPLQNGVNAEEKINESIEDFEPIVLEGCIYIASNIEKVGVIKHIGGPGKIFFGNNDQQEYKWVEDVLRKGGIDATYTHDIKKILWKKYLFVSPLAAITTAYGVTFGELAARPELVKQLKNLMQEVQSLANVPVTLLTDNDVEEALNMLSNFPYGAKSSLQLDIEKGNAQTEKAILVDYLIEEGKKRGIPTETYCMMEKLIA